MDHIQVISRDTIPPVQGSTREGGPDRPGELRDFGGDDRLREFMSEVDDISVSWMRLAEGEMHTPPAHTGQLILVVYAGSGCLIGGVDRDLAQGDVVVPAGCECVVGGGTGGLHGLALRCAAPSDSGAAPTTAPAAGGGLPGLL